MSKSFFDSSTIKAGLDLESTNNTASTIAVAAGSLAPILLGELGVSDPVAGALSMAVNGAISGQSVEAIAIGAGLTLAKHLVDKKVNKAMAKQVIDGRINAIDDIDKATIPNEYKGD